MILKEDVQQLLVVGLLGVIHDLCTDRDCCHLQMHKSCCRMYHRACKLARMFVIAVVDDSNKLVRQPT